MGDAVAEERQLHIQSPGAKVSARFQSQGARAWAAPERQHLVNLATLTSPMSADAVTNGSGGGDSKAAAGTAMRVHTCPRHM